MSILILPILAGIAAFFLAVKSYQKLKKLKYYPLVIVGSILTIIIGVIDEVEDNQIKNKFTSEMEQFNLRLDTLKPTPEIKQITTDYDQWVLNLPTELQRKMLRHEQEILDANAEKLSSRAFTTFSFNCFKSSLKAYTEAYNGHFGNTIAGYFQETDAMADKSVAILRGEKNTYYLEFTFDENRYLSGYTDNISFYQIPNEDFDQSLSDMNSKDTLEMAMRFLGFKLSLLDHLKYSLNIDRGSSLMKISELDGLLLKPKKLSKIFKSQYNLSQSARKKIDFIAQQLFERILISEDLLL